MLESITPLILTYNESANIGRTLERLSWAKEIVIVDSLSTDSTASIASKFPNTRLVTREFDTHARQWSFGLHETGIEAEWILALDADYILTPELESEIRNLRTNDSVAGYRVSFKYCIDGRPIKSAVYPPVIVLYKREAAKYVQDGHTHRVVLNGGTADLEAPMLHDDRKDLTLWFPMQSRYASLEAKKLQEAKPHELSWPDKIRRWRFLAPGLMLAYCLVVRGGAFQGRRGFYYAFQRTVAELMLSLYLIEEEWRRRSNDPDDQPKLGSRSSTVMN